MNLEPRITISVPRGWSDDVLERVYAEAERLATEFQVGVVVHIPYSVTYLSRYFTPHQDAEK